jgi:hypothetical protein
MQLNGTHLRRNLQLYYQTTLIVSHITFKIHVITMLIYSKFFSHRICTHVYDLFNREQWRLVIEEAKAHPGL